MGAKSEDAGVRACRHLREMVGTEMVRKLADRYAAHGVIGGSDLGGALADVEWAVADFERSPTGPSTRNALVLALVRRTCVERLRGIARRIERARDAGDDLYVDDLKGS